MHENSVHDMDDVEVTGLALPSPEMLQQSSISEKDKEFFTENSEPRKETSQEMSYDPRQFSILLDDLAEVCDEAKEGWRWYYDPPETKQYNQQKQLKKRRINYLDKRIDSLSDEIYKTLKTLIDKFDWPENDFENLDELKKKIESGSGEQKISPHRELVILARSVLASKREYQAVEIIEPAIGSQHRTEMA